jgi:NAD(P)-dependent dehydrogenase (short-subunit alcohol dehydrogenase family)
LSDLNGKVAIVTGGGRGIGRTHALALARRGAAVVVNDVGIEFSGDGQASSGPADSVAQEIIAAGGRAIADYTDIADWEAVKGIVDVAVREFGGLDIVVNNAAIARFGPIDAISRQDWERTIAVNLNGTAALCHWAAAYWRQQGPANGRRLINTSSGVGLTLVPGNPMYAAAKAGVAALTISCAIELAELGVRVNAIAPAARSRISEFVSAGALAHIPEGFDAMAPEHVATLVEYLASPECRFTGRVIGVIGDDLTMFDGWTVSGHVNNSQRAWTFEGVAAPLVARPLQHEGTAQGMVGTTPNVTPSAEVLAALAAVEGA